MRVSAPICYNFLEMAMVEGTGFSEVIIYKIFYENLMKFRFWIIFWISLCLM